MTEEQLAAIKARCEAATPGEWRHSVIRDGRFVMAPCPGGGYASLWEAKAVSDPADLDFAAHAREDVPALLAYIEELEADLRMHKEDRLRLRAENLRLSGGLK